MKPLLTGLFVFIYAICFAQKRIDSIYFATMKSRIISLPSIPNDSTYNLPFNHINVLDVRLDTTCVGFLKRGDYTTRLILNKDISVEFNEYIHQHYNLSTDSNNLLILIKEFRTTNYAQTNGISSQNVLQWSGGCMISAELYLNNNSDYRALYKVDSLLIESSSKELLTDLIAESFRTILKKAENKNLSHMHVGKTIFSFNNIQNHINDFTNFPILKDTVLNKGVYVNFSEFRSNNPFIKNYTLNKGRLSDELFVTENNQPYHLENFWGYCDGENIFIFSANNLFKLIRIGNTYNVKAMKSLKKNAKRTVGTEVASTFLLGFPMSSLSPEKFSADITAFQLNMQNGELY